MALITRASIRTTQPQQPCALDDYWLSKKPVLLVCPTFGPRNIITDYYPTVTGTVNTVYGCDGAAFKQNAADNYYTYEDLPFGGTSPVSLFVYADGVGTISGGTWIIQGTEIGLRRNAASTGAEFILNSFSTNDRAAVNTTVSLKNGGFIAAGTYGASGNLAVYANGTRNSVVPTGSYANSTAGFALLDNASLTGTNSKVYLAAVFASELTAQDVDALTENPWQIFAPERRFFAVGDTTGLSLTPSLFTNTSSFQTPTVSVGAVTLTPSLFANSAQFHTPTVSQSAAPQTLTPSLFADGDTFYSPTVTGPQALTPDAFANSNVFYLHAITGGAVAERRGGGGTNTRSTNRQSKRQKVWLVTVDEEEIEVDDLSEIKPVIAKKLAKGKRPVIKAKPQVDTVQQVAEAYAAQPMLTQYVPIPSKRFEYVDMLPYFIAMQEAEEEEELLLLIA